METKVFLKGEVNVVILPKGAEEEKEKLKQYFNSLEEDVNVSYLKGDMVCKDTENYNDYVCRTISEGSKTTINVIDFDLGMKSDLICDFCKNIAAENEIEKITKDLIVDRKIYKAVMFICESASAAVLYKKKDNCYTVIKHRNKDIVRTGVTINQLI